ncbi:MAG: DUF3604 domain-containing protein [Myxococcota bacterium]
MSRALILVAIVLVGVLFAWFRWVGQGGLGEHETAGRITPTRRAATLDAARQAEIAAAERSLIEQASSAERDSAPVHPKQILFGDLHVHTTFSFDAFMLSLPLAGGEGAHPPADACDFARFCSALDFWSINDHAESITPAHWSETVESVRACNAVAGDGGDRRGDEGAAAEPDTVAFLGWEWTQVGPTPQTHYGHKNVVLRDLDADRVPTRPIGAAALRGKGGIVNPFGTARSGAFLRALDAPRMHDLARFLRETGSVPTCPPGVPVRSLPPDCMELADSPDLLFEKLDDWGVDSLVIPHGTTWGFYTPPGSDWSKQLRGAMHDEARQRLIEVYSGHGNSEEYRDFRAVEYGPDGRARCPAPSADYLPTCWRAGEIVEARCLAAGESDETCAERAATARRHAVDAGSQMHLTVPGVTAADWIDAGQCRDCTQPAFNYRPGGAAQFILALSDFATPGTPRRFRFGLIASSDNHFGRPGTGYKEVHRRGFTESRDDASGAGVVVQRMVAPPAEAPLPESRPFDLATTKLTGFALREMERQASYFMTGGLVAAHSAGRSRTALWEAFERREVYGTSGPRILLWFDLVNPPGGGDAPPGGGDAPPGGGDAPPGEGDAPPGGGDAQSGEGEAPPGERDARVPMGGEVAMNAAPRFEVRAVGSFEQRPGCPDDATTALGPERLARVCLGECYNPSEKRRPITRIEVVRIRPQRSADEPIAPLIEDPWRRFACDGSPEGCTVRFDDPEFAAGGRDTVYYVRAIEPPAPAINADGIRCERDAEGRCLEATRCSRRLGDDCLGTEEPRAWSSPIFVDWSP